MQIDDPAFQDFRDGRLVPDPPAVADRREVRRVQADPAAARRAPSRRRRSTDPRRPAGRRPVPAAAGAQRQGGRPRPGQQHHARAVRGPLPADPQRARRRARRPRPRARRDRRARRPGAARDQPGARDPAPGRTSALARLASDGDAVLTPLAARARERRRLHQLVDHGRGQATAERQRRPRGRLREAARRPARAALDDGRARRGSPTPRRRSSPTSAPAAAIADRPQPGRWSRSRTRPSRPSPPSARPPTRRAPRSSPRTR